jgi:hypothetical protein
MKQLVSALSRLLGRHPVPRPLARRPRALPRLEPLEARDVPTGTWTGLTNNAPTGTGTMMLLSNGSVMVEGSGETNAWYNLTPDANGSYANGTWSTLASMHVQRLYFGSNILKNGQVFVVGGEYATDQSFSRSGEIYNPKTNSWTTITPFTNSQFGDDPTIVLDNGKVLAGYISGPQTYLYDPSANTWTATGTKLRNDQSDEETWIKLKDGSILSYDVFSSISTGVGHAQRYVPSSGTWVDASNGAPNNLSSSAVGYELGPAFLLPDGRAFFLGATGHTAYYDPSTNTWTAGPDIPNGRGADDAPGAIMPNGKILFAADTPKFNGPTHVYEFDPNGGTNGTYTDVTPSISGLSTSGASYTDRMLVLPTGQILYTTGGSKLAVYTPDGSSQTSWQPTISSITANSDGTFTLTGTQLNGISEGASYGDDAEMSSNYPIIRLTGDDGKVHYAYSHDWSSTNVQTGSTSETTNFDLPSGLASGHYTVTVIANGIASATTDLYLANTFNQGGFETPNVGTGTYGAFQYNPSGSAWTFDNNSGVAGNGSGFTSGNPNAPEGTQVAFLQGTGTFSQSVVFTAGTYSISFKAAQRGNFQASSQTFEVLEDGNVIGTFTPGSTNYDSFTTNSFNVTAGAHTIMFVGLNPNGGDNTAFIDQARINTVAPILSNAGFEAPNVGTGTFGAFQYNPSGTAWKFDDNSGVAGNGSGFTSGNPNAPEGTQVAFLQGTGSFSQSATFTAGTYTLNFMAAQRGNFQASSQTFQVLVDGVVIGTFTPGSTTYTGFSASFTVTAGNHTITFVGTNPNGGDNTAFIDQVQILH